VSDNAVGITVTVALLCAVLAIGFWVSEHGKDQEQTNRACIQAGGQVVLDNCVRPAK